MEHLAVAESNFDRGVSSSFSHARSKELRTMQIESWLHEAGMHTWTVAVANVHGRMHGQELTCPALSGIGCLMQTLGQSCWLLA